MSVKPIIPSIETNKNNSNKIKSNTNNNVSFGSTNPIVASMNFIDKGGYATAFCIQDGLGFIFPRVGGGLIRGKHQKVDENGNPIYDKKGNPVNQYNWALARKELVRELITGPSAFVIPWLSLIGIKKVASGNNVKLNYINGFNDAFTEYVKNNTEAIKNGTAQKHPFYQRIFENAINESINKNLPDAEKMSTKEIKRIADDYATRQIKTESIIGDKTLSKKARAEKLKDIGSITDDFMQLKKNKIGGIVDELSVSIKSTDGQIRSGNISELLSAMRNYYTDAEKNIKKALTNNASADIDKIIKSFTNRRMGTRIFTNLGLFGIVAAFYTQIPKLYNLGLKSNPALMGTAAENLGNNKIKTDTPENKTNKSQVAFQGLGSFMEKTGKAVFHNNGAKKISDMFEFNGPVISGAAMPVLLYGFCIPSRLSNAQDKYDYGEVILRDMTSFTVLLFGAKALARVFSDFLTEKTGLALNRKNFEGRTGIKKFADYLRPSNVRHHVLTSAEIDSKYTHIENYKNGVNGFVEFIEKSGGNIKKAFTKDKAIKKNVEDILQQYKNTTYAKASNAEIKEALKLAQAENSTLIKDFYKLFNPNNGLLKSAKTWNSTFNFISTFVMVPALIIWLTQACKKMTERRTAKDLKAMEAAQTPAQNSPKPSVIKTSAPTMAGFLNK